MLCRQAKGAGADAVPDRSAGGGPDSGPEAAAQGSQVSPFLHMHMHVPLSGNLAIANFSATSAYGWSLTLQVTSAQRKLLVMLDSDQMIWQVCCTVSGGLANGWRKIFNWFESAVAGTRRRLGRCWTCQT